MESFVALAPGLSSTAAQLVTSLVAEIALVLREAGAPVHLADRVRQRPEQQQQQALLSASAAAAPIAAEQPGPLGSASPSIPSAGSPSDGSTVCDQSEPYTSSRQLPDTPTAAPQRAAARPLPPPLWVAAPARPQGSAAQSQLSQPPPPRQQPPVSQGAQRQPHAPDAPALDQHRHTPAGPGGVQPPRAATAAAVATPALLPPAAREAAGLATDGKVQFVLESATETVEDGYRWRKYGRKTVAGSQHLRHYFKCTMAGCPVRKHVERLVSDPAKILVSYDYLPHVHAPVSNHQQLQLARMLQQPGTPAGAPQPPPLAPACAPLAGAHAAPPMQAAAAPALGNAAGPGPVPAPAALHQQPQQPVGGPRPKPLAAEPPLEGGSSTLLPPCVPLVGPRSPRQASAFSRWKDPNGLLAAGRDAGPQPHTQRQGHAVGLVCAARVASDRSSGSDGEAGERDSSRSGARAGYGNSELAALRRARGKAPRVEASEDGTLDDDAMDAESTGSDVQLFEEVIAEMHTGRR